MIDKTGDGKHQHQARQQRGENIHFLRLEDFPLLQRFINFSLGGVLSLFLAVTASSAIDHRP